MYDIPIANLLSKSPNLQILEFEGNMLNPVLLVDCEMPSVKKVRFAMGLNKIETVRNLLTNVPNLQELQLSVKSNGNDDLTCHLPHLRKLDLNSGSYGSTITPSFPKGLPRIEELSLSQESLKLMAPCLKKNSLTKISVDGQNQPLSAFTATLLTNCSPTLNHLSLKNMDFSGDLEETPPLQVLKVLNVSGCKGNVNAVLKRSSCPALEQLIVNDKCLNLSTLTKITNDGVKIDT